MIRDQRGLLLIHAYMINMLIHAQNDSPVSAATPCPRQSRVCCYPMFTPSPCLMLPRVHDSPVSAATPCPQQSRVYKTHVSTTSTCPRHQRVHNSHVSMATAKRVPATRTYMYVVMAFLKYFPHHTKDFHNCMCIVPMSRVLSGCI